MYNHANKEHNLAQYNNYTLAKTLSMFEYQALPETIPYYEIEKQLQKNGFTFITEVEGKLYALSGGLGGVQDVYGNPTEIVISNPALGFNKTLNLEKDGVLIQNDDLLIGLMPLLNKYNSALVENDINLLLAGYNARMTTVISASDDKTKASAQAYIDDIINGKVSVIGEAALFDGVKTHNAQSNQSSSITSLIEFHQYMKASLNNELGLNSNFNMKRERLISGEVDAVEDVLYPFIDNMMKCRLKAIEKVNEKYGQSIEVDYGSVWYRKNKNAVDDIVETTNEGENENEQQLKNGIEGTANSGSENHNQEETLNESTDESTEESTDEPAETAPLTEVEEIDEMLKDESLTDEERETLEAMRVEAVEKECENDE